MIARHSVSQKYHMEDPESFLVVGSLMFGFSTFLCMFLIFAPPLCLQAAMVRGLEPRLGCRAYIAVLLALPIIALTTWFCFDYLTPSDITLAISSGGYSYKHGLSILRCNEILGAQCAVSLLVTLHAAMVIGDLPRLPMLRWLSAIATAGGLVIGYLIWH